MGHNSDSLMLFMKRLSVCGFTSQTRKALVDVIVCDYSVIDISSIFYSASMSIISDILSA